MENLETLRRDIDALQSDQRVHLAVIDALTNAIGVLIQQHPDHRRLNLALAAVQDAPELGLMPTALTPAQLQVSQAVLTALLRLEPPSAPATQPPSAPHGP